MIEHSMTRRDSESRRSALSEVICLPEWNAAYHCLGIQVPPEIGGVAQFLPPLLETAEGRIYGDAPTRIFWYSSI